MRKYGEADRMARPTGRPFEGGYVKCESCLEPIVGQVYCVIGLDLYKWNDRCGQDPLCGPCACRVKRFLRAFEDVPDR